MKKAALITLLSLIVLAGLAVAGVRIFDVPASHYRQELAQRLSQRLDAAVSIQSMDLRWGWQGPVLQLNGVRISPGGSDGAALRIPKLRLQFSLLDLVRGARLPDAVILYEPHFQFTIHPLGWTGFFQGQSGTPARINWQLIARLREVLDYVAIKNATVDITFATGSGTRQLHLYPVDAVLRDSEGVLELTAAAQAGAWLGKLTLEARIVGPLPNFKSAQLTVEADNLTGLALWEKRAQKAAMSALAGGKVDLKLDAYWQSGQFDHARIKLTTTAVHGKKLEKPLVPALQATFSVRPADDRENVIRISLTRLSGADPALAQVRLSARINTEEMVLRLRARHIAAGLFAPLLRLRIDALSGARISGAIETVELTLADGRLVKASATFEQIALATSKFSFGPVSGHYHYDSGRNTLRFTDAGGALRIDRYLRGALPITDLGGQLSWQMTGQGLRFAANDLRLTSNATTMTLNGSLTLPGEGVPVADLNLHLTTPNAPKLLAHVPQTEGMPFDRLRDWLPQAIEHGKAVVDAYLKGPLNKMFAGEGKHFGVTIKGTGFTLEYKPGWPRLTNASGIVRLRGDTLTIDINAGQILGVAFDHAEIHVANVRQAVLRLEGTITSGPAATMMSFLARSPLQERFGTLVEVLEIQGKAGLELELRVPLTENPRDEVKVSGVIHARNTTVGHEALPAPIRSVSGDIHFSGAGLRAENLEGRLLGVHLTTDITPAARGDTIITSRGRVALPENTELLAHYLPKPWLDLAHGSAMVEVSLRVDTRGAISKLTLHSDLQGMALELPEPLHKPAGSAVPLTVKVKDGGRVTLRYGDKVRVNMTFDGDQLQRAVVLLGATPDVQPPAGPGLWLGGHVHMLPVGRWLEALSKLNNGGGNNSGDRDAGLRFLGANLDITVLRLGERQVHQVHLRIERLPGEDGWRIVVRGPNARGHATWRPTANGHSLLRAHFARLHIETLDSAPQARGQATNGTPRQANSVLTDFDPRRLPALDVTIEQLRIGSTHFGTATIKASAIEHGWRLERATLSGGVLSLRASGQWLRRMGMTEARLDIQLEGRGLARLLKALGYDPLIRARHMSVEASLRIGLNPNGLDLAALSGQLSLTIDDGIIRSIDPGAGRLLGLFNLYVLPRRLMLDFSDVVAEGLVFDKITGDFNIVSGDAFTDNLTIQTPAATIRIVGRINLAAREYDLTVIVDPKLGSGLAVASTVLGGPVAGVAVFALQKLFDTPLDSLSSFSYQVKGDWNDPRLVNPQATQ